MDENVSDSARSNLKKLNYQTRSGHNLRKRQPQRPERGDSVVYVNSNSNVKGLLDKCEQLIKKGKSEIIIYCMGAAIQRGILLSLQLQEQQIGWNVAVNTSTTTLLDDLEPSTDEADYEIQKRNNSALKIRLFR